MTAELSLNQLGFLCRASLDRRATSALPGWVTDANGRIYRIIDTGGVEARREVSLGGLVQVLERARPGSRPLAAASLEAIRLRLSMRPSLKAPLGVALIVLAGLLAVHFKTDLTGQWARGQQVALIAGAPLGMAFIVRLGDAVYASRLRARGVVVLNQARPSPEGALPAERVELDMAEELGGRAFYLAQPLFNVPADLAAVPQAAPLTEEPPGSPHSGLPGWMHHWAALAGLTTSFYLSVDTETTNTLVHLHRYFNHRRTAVEALPEGAERTAAQEAFLAELRQIMAVIIFGCTNGGCTERRNPLFNSFYFSTVAPGAYQPESDTDVGSLTRALLPHRRGIFERVALVKIGRWDSESTVALPYLQHGYRNRFSLGAYPAGTFGGGRYNHVRGRERAVGQAFIKQYTAASVGQEVARLMNMTVPRTNRTKEQSDLVDLKGRLDEWLSRRYLSLQGAGDAITGLFHAEMGLLIAWRTGLVTDDPTQAHRLNPAFPS